MNRNAKERLYNKLMISFRGLPQEKMVSSLVATSLRYFSRKESERLLKTWGQ